MRRAALHTGHGDLARTAGADARAAGVVSSHRPALVHGRDRHADAGAGARLGGDPRRPAHPDRRADRIRQDAGGVPHRPRRPAAGGPGRSAAGRGARRLRLAAEGAEQRHPQEPRRAARRHRAAGGRDGPRRPAHHRGGPHRRHVPGPARGDAPQAAARPRDDSGVALPDADRRAQPRSAAARAHGDRRRDPRGDRDAARRAPGPDARAARPRQRASGAADRPLGHATAGRGRRALPGRIGERRRRRVRRLRRRRRRPSPRHRPRPGAAADRRSRR